MFRFGVLSLVLFGLTVFSPPAFADELSSGMELYKAKKFSAAEEVLRGVVAQDPDNVQARQTLGLALLELNRYAEAEAHFKKALEGNEESRAQAKVGLARSYIHRDMLREARTELNDAEQLKPDLPDVYHYRGVLKLKQNDYKGAVADLSKAIELNPEDAYAHYYIGMAYSRLKQPDKMVEHFQTFLKHAPDAPEAAKVRSLLRSL